MGLFGSESKERQILTSITADEMATILKDMGFSPELATDSAGDPMIRLPVEGLKSLIFFYGGSGGRYESYQYSAGFRMETKPGHEAVNEWNRKKRFGKVYLDSEDDPHIEMDVSLSGGVQREYISETVRTWRAVFGAFLRHIGY